MAVRQILKRLRPSTKIKKLPRRVLRGRYFGEGEGSSEEPPPDSTLPPEIMSFGGSTPMEFETSTPMEWE